MWPDDDTLLAAWRALVADSTTAGAFAGLVLGPLEADLARRFPAADPDHRTEAADCAVAAFLRRPEAFDPGRLPLPAFLRLVARRDLLNLRARDGRHHRGRVPWANVELGVAAGNQEDDADTFADHPELLAAVAALSAADRAVFELMRAGERETGVFARALGLGEMSEADRAAEVKRAKDRVMVRLKRAGRGA